jgi:hypothetical protein
MATAAQIEANRRNCQRSTGPRTEEGKNRSRMNALDHGCRANILVLPTENLGEYQEKANDWKLSWQPRNPVEEFLVNRVVTLSWLAKRIDRAQTARLSARIHRGEVDGADQERETVIELGQRLFQDACGPGALWLALNTAETSADPDTPRVSDYSSAEDHPQRLVHRLQTTVTGCQWLLDQWADLRALLERGVPWLAPDKLKAIRLLGRHPIDAIESIEVAQVYLASHVLLDQEGDPFQEILNELAVEEAPVYMNYLRMRRYDALKPKDAAAARQWLLELVDRTSDRLRQKAEMHRELAELDAAYAADGLSWDDTPEGERLGRYELTCQRTLLRMFELLLKVRRTGEELDIATIRSLGRFNPSDNINASDKSTPAVAPVITPPAEPVNEPAAPNEANPVREIAPNEANSDVQAPSSARQNGHKELRIDTPHVDGKAGGFGITGKEAMHPALRWLLTGQGSALLDLLAISARTRLPAT